MDLVTVSQAARALGARPRDISDLFYARRLDDSICPLLGGRRVIPCSYLGDIRYALVQCGKLPVEELAG